MRCKDCKHWTKEAGFNFGKCSTPKFTYTFTRFGNMGPVADGVMIEFDEEWGAYFGPEFGCIHFEERP